MRTVALNLVAIFALTGCLSDPNGRNLAGGIGDGEITTGSFWDDLGGRDAGATAPTADEGSSVGSGSGTIEPGTLTAGAWDDNRNFDFFAAFRAELIDQISGALPIGADAHAEAHSSQSATRTKQTLDVALVIDTTGSMTDEIAYLQTEFLALSLAIEAAYPNAEQRWALVVYRDDGDEYLVRWFDFRSSAEEFRTKLAAQGASGGGDYPEAPDKAFEIMNQFAWRLDETTARLAFWVADAPHHDENAEALARGILDSQYLDIHVYPVASSGVDGLTELSMRSAAQLTGGRYLFLTDDSGVGGAHMEPTLPCYFVTKLDDAILRMVDIEMTAQYREPTAEEIIRTGGDPQNGACVIESGESVLVY